MNNIDKQYQKLLQDIIHNGVEKKDRTGTGTISVFGRQIRHKMSEGFPLLTTKKMAWKSIVTELLWFLRGDTNIKYLVDNVCHIWDGDAYKNFLKTYEGRDGEIILPPDDYINDDGELLSQEKFINKCKTDTEFSERWGLKIEERELSEGERGLLLQPLGLDPLTKEGRDRLWKENNIPTRLITITYNDKTIESYK